MRRYCMRKDTQTGARHTLAEALLPEDLEKHVQLQRARLDTYAKLREEVVLYAEARGYAATKPGGVAKPKDT
eukprot:4709287-Amphidinium_carterae.1